MSMIGRLLLGLLLFLWVQTKRAIAGLLSLIIAAIIGGSLFAAIANYTATQGTGTTFASIVISNVHYLANVLCDATAGQSTCLLIGAGGSSASTTGGWAKVQIDPNSPGLIQAVSNAASATPSSSTNVPGIAYLYGYNGATWDQLQVDGSKNLKVVSAGTQTNATSGQTTSTTNGATVSWLYGFNGTTWDQLQVDGSKNLKVSIAANLANADPCTNTLKKYVSISQTGNVQLITGVASTKTYICSYFYNGSDAENISLVEGTGTVCATNTYALIGAATANAGNNFTAGSGVAQGNGQGTVVFGSGDSHATAANVCLYQSGSGTVAGVIGYVQQ